MYAPTKHDPKLFVLFFLRSEREYLVPAQTNLKYVTRVQMQVHPFYQLNLKAFTCSVIPGRFGNIWSQHNSSMQVLHSIILLFTVLPPNWYVAEQVSRETELMQIWTLQALTYSGPVTQLGHYLQISRNIQQKKT